MSKTANTQTTNEHFSLNKTMRQKTVGLLVRQLEQSDDPKNRLAAARTMVAVDRNNIARGKTYEDNNVAGSGEPDQDLRLDSAARQKAVAALLELAGAAEDRLRIAAIRVLLSADRINISRERAGTDNAADHWPLAPADRQEIVDALNQLLDNADERICLAAVRLVLTADRCNIARQQAEAKQTNPAQNDMKTEKTAASTPAKSSKATPRRPKQHKPTRTAKQRSKTKRTPAKQSRAAAA